MYRLCTFRLQGFIGDPLSVFLLPNPQSPISDSSVLGLPSTEPFSLQTAGPFSGSRCSLVVQRPFRVAVNFRALLRLESAFPPQRLNRIRKICSLEVGISEACLLRFCRSLQSNPSCVLHAPTGKGRELYFRGLRTQAWLNLHGFPSPSDVSALSLLPDVHHRSRR